MHPVWSGCMCSISCWGAQGFPRFRLHHSSWMETFFVVFFLLLFFFFIHLKSSPHPLHLFRKMLQVGGVGNDWIFILGERFFYTRYMLLRDLQGCWLKNVGLGTESGKQVTLTPLWNGLCFARLIVSGLHTDHRQECDDTVTSLLEKIRWNNQQHKLFL